jgi:hypothetical protein
MSNISLNLGFTPIANEARKPTLEKKTDPHETPISSLGKSK